MVLSSIVLSKQQGRFGAPLTSEEVMKLRANIFEVKDNLKLWGFWYCIWYYGVENLWTIWCAHRMNKYEQWNLHDRFNLSDFSQGKLIGDKKKGFGGFL